jgi:hypothetical protein
MLSTQQWRQHLQQADAITNLPVPQKCTLSRVNDNTLNTQ